MVSIKITGELVDLNTYINAERGNRFYASKLKKEETERVYWECKEQGIKPIEKYPVTLRCIWYTKNERKDIDNVAFAKKFILDGLVLAGVLIDDSRKYVAGLEDFFHVDKNLPRIEVDILDI